MKLENDTYLILFSNCIPVKGYKQSTICDLQRNKFEHLPNDLIDFLIISEKKPLKKIYKESCKENLQTIMDYVEFIVSNEFGFLGTLSEKGKFISLNLEWDYPAIILNSIIEVNKNTYVYFDKIINFLEKLGCEHILLKLSEEIKYNELQKILLKLNVSIINSIRIILFFDVKIPVQIYEKLIDENKRIDVLFIQIPKDNKNIKTKHTKLRFFNSNHSIFPKYSFFSVNISMFTESQKHHTYFNRKLYIGTNGEIKNAPECSKIFGYIQDLKNVEELKKIIANPEFQKYWFINKDICNICKDCEYRYMCLDNRLPVKGKNGDWYFKQTCTYNPYKVKWSE
jgi:SPASM domain peptide maturase of grasp-with-spasm system